MVSRSLVSALKVTSKIPEPTVSRTLTNDRTDCIASLNSTYDLELSCRWGLQYIYSTFNRSLFYYKLSTCKMARQRLVHTHSRLSTFGRTFKASCSPSFSAGSSILGFRHELDFVVAMFVPWSDISWRQVANTNPHLILNDPSAINLPTFSDSIKYCR